MSRTLSHNSSRDNLRKDAKRWLKALRAGDQQARRRLLAATPAAPANPTLRDVQLALAREYGQPGWGALLEALEHRAMARRSHEERVAIVLQSAWNGDPAAAARIVKRWPEIGSDNLCLAAATGNLTEVERRLAADPAAATRPARSIGSPCSISPMRVCPVGKCTRSTSPAPCSIMAPIRMPSSMTAGEIPSRC